MNELEETKLDLNETSLCGADNPLDTAVEDSSSNSLMRKTINIDHLIDNYRQLIRYKEIYYPLAYKFTKELGRGRQGIVFHAYRQGARGCLTQHAIKVHDPSIYPTTEKYWNDMGRIAAQVSRMQKVSSPQLVSRDIYEEVNGIGYTQMELIDGIDVHHLIHGNHFDYTRARSSDDEWKQFNQNLFSVKDGLKRIKPGVALFVMRQVLRGLEELHGAGFLHSDIKPANIMVDKLGIVKLIDYGRAVRIDEKNNYLMGTPLFMAPELHRREPASIQSDIYSVGLVGLELLRGESLVDLSNMKEKELLAFKNTLPERLDDLLPTFAKNNPFLVELLRKFIDPDPAKRYASAQEAESGDEGINRIHKQLVKVGLDSEYDRELGKYIEKVKGGPAKTRKPIVAADTDLITGFQR
jgi:serine/threonine-protein kinase